MPGKFDCPACEQGVQAGGEPLPCLAGGEGLGGRRPGEAQKLRRQEVKSGGKGSAEEEEKKKDSPSPPVLDRLGQPYDGGGRDEYSPGADGQDELAQGRVHEDAVPVLI